jgi:hypothetical protein
MALILVPAVVAYLAVTWDLKFGTRCTADVLDAPTQYAVVPVCLCLSLWGAWTIASPPVGHLRRVAAALCILTFYAMLLGISPGLLVFVMCGAR